MKRNSSGNMLALIAAFTILIIIICLFALGFVRILGSSSEQRTAIEAAALACARDLSNMVVPTDEFGYVGLSDSAPIGTNTSATDNYYTQVHSINTLIGTARLDLIIADTGNVDVAEWRTLAKLDLQRARDVWNNDLYPALQTAITPTGQGTDRNGNILTPYISAEKAYKDNQIRMTGSSNYVAGSLVLALGEIQTVTNIPVPSPLSADPSLDSTTMANGFYKAYVNIPYGGQDFVFAGIGSSIQLLDPKKWTDQVSGLPYHLPCIVRAEAQQNLGSATGNRNIASAACAQPASVFDPVPAPGALVVSFPDGIPDNGPPDFPPPPALTLKHLYGPALDQPSDDSDFYHSDTGDYPTDSSSSIAYDSTFPLADPVKLASNCCKLSVYDWLKRGGTKVNVDSAVGIHSTPFNTNFGALGVPATSLWPIQFAADEVPIATGSMHIYRFDPDGVIWYDFDAIKPVPFSVVADNQILIECHDALDKCAKKFKITKMKLGPPLNVTDGEVEFSDKFDLYIRIFGRKPGAQGGGKHAGEPLGVDPVISSVPPPLRVEINREGSGTTCYVIGSGAKAVGAKGKAIGVGKGALPDIGPREDFMFQFNAATGNWDIDRGAAFYRSYTPGTGFRPTYKANGIATEIRFRRVLKATKGFGFYGLEDGYVVDKRVP